MGKVTKETELIMQTYFQSSNEVLYWNKMANDKVHEVSKQLLGVAAIAIPLTGTIVIERHPINAIIGTTLAFGLFFLIISFAAGIVQMNIDSAFFNDYAKFNASRSSRLYRNRNKSFNEATVTADLAGRFEKLTAGVNTTYQTIQNFSIWIGLMIISGVIVALIFT